MHPEPHPKEIAGAIENLERIVTLFRGRRVPLSRRQAAILDVLAAEPSTLTELAAALGTTKAPLSRAIERLEKRRLVARTRSVDDGRRVRIELTAEGERARRLPVRFDAEGVAQGISELPPEQRPAMRRCLRVLARRETFAGVPIS